MQENLLAARAPPRSSLRRAYSPTADRASRVTALPQPPSWWGGVGCPLSKDPTLASDRNGRLDPSQHDGWAESAYGA